MPRFRPGLWPTLFVLMSMPVLIGLGLWQLDRREWKQELIARIEARATAAPVPLPRPGDDLAAVEFRRVRLEGRFLPERAQLIVGRSHRGRSGYAVIVPFALADGRYVLVDRGWMPGPAQEPAAGGAAAVLEGAIRLPPVRRTAAPVAPQGTQHFSMDLETLARASGLDPARVAPVYAVETEQPPDEALPIRRRAAVELPDNHLQYAVTWFGLAAGLLAIYLTYGLGRRE